MSKIKIETLGCYQQVLDVIGVENTKVELFKAMESYKAPVENTWKLDLPLLACFYWAGTVQDHEFWDDINNGRWPYEE